MDEYDELLDLDNTSEEINYNKIPVYYCKRCLSLAIMNVPEQENSDFCNECFSTDVDITDINTWEQLYQEKYGKKYINK